MKKRAWNNSNPLYRYLKNKKARTANTTMARKRSRRGSFSRRVARRSSGRSNGSLLMTVGASALYGFGRSKLSALSAQYIPSFAGQYTDEVVLGTLGWYLSKKGGMIGALGKSALIIESASIGNQLGSSLMGTSTVNNSQFYV